MKIYKYPITPGETLLPKGKLLDIQAQGDNFVAWVHLDDNKPGYSVVYYFTGDSPSPMYTYFKTVQAGSLVWHFYFKRV